MTQTRHYRVLLVTLALLAGGFLAGCGGDSSSPTTPAGDITRMKHIVVVYQENWSYDALYGSFPGGNGTPVGTTVKQVDKSGNPLPSISQPIDTNLKPAAPDSRFPATLPVKTYDLTQYVQPGQQTGDIIHRFYHEQLQIDGGAMDKFAAWSDNPGLVLSQFDATSLPEGQIAQQYTLADSFFHSAFGGSFLNHQWLIAANTPLFPNAPAKIISNPDPSSSSFNDGIVTPDGRAVNTVYTAYLLPPFKHATDTDLLPPQDAPTIGDELNTAGVSWKWYAGGWNNVLAGDPDPLFQFHHQPFTYYRNYAPGTAARNQHLRDEQEFFTDVSGGTLPSVVFIKPLGPDNEHPGYASLQQGQQHVATIVNAIMNSPYAQDTGIVITYDENGGRWDHVSPPTIDRWGPGTRVPAIIAGKFAKRHFVDHTTYETDSILKLIETRFNVPPLGTRDANANGLTNAFNFNQ